MAPENSRASVFRVRARAGDCPLQADMRLIGGDVLVSLWGGTGPHIGAVAIAVPRGEGGSAGGPGATLSMYTFPGHRDDVVAGMIARRVSSELQRTAVVTAGIHMDRITAEGIETILQAVEAMCGRLINKARGRMARTQG